jgi:hypothetical protein
VVGSSGSGLALPDDFWEYFSGDSSGEWEFGGAAAFALVAAVYSYKDVINLF